MLRTLASRQIAAAALAISAISGLALVPARADPGTDIAAGAAGPMQTPAQVRSNELARIAASMGISAAEVADQMRLQDAMDTIDFPSIDPGFAEYGSTPGHHFGIWYRSADTPSKSLTDALAARGLLPYVTFVRVPLSLGALTSKAVAVQKQLEAAGLPVGASIDTATGGVVLHDTKQATAGGAAQPLGADTKTAAEQIPTKEAMPFRWGEPVPTPAFIGGKRLQNTSAGSTCTGGFTVASGSNRMMLTAGHCGHNGDAVTYATASGFTFANRKYDAFNDEATIDRSGTAFDPTVNMGIDTRTVTGGRSWAGMNVGDFVAKYGVTTGYTAGTIVNKFACGAGGCDPESTFVEVAQMSGYSQMCAPGDSGGPFMWNNTAYGITSAYITPNYHCVFLPQQRMGNIGLTLVTG